MTGLLNIMLASAIGIYACFQDVTCCDIFDKSHCLRSELHLAARLYLYRLKYPGPQFDPRLGVDLKRWPVDLLAPIIGLVKAWGGVRGGRIELVAWRPVDKAPCLPARDRVQLDVLKSRIL